MHFQGVGWGVECVVFIVLSNTFGVGWCWMDKYLDKSGTTKGQVLDEKC